SRARRKSYRQRSRATRNSASKSSCCKCAGRRCRYNGQRCRCQTRRNLKGMSTRSISLRDFDWVMFSIMVGISAIGILQIYSTTINTAFAGAHQKQILWMVLGIAVMFLFARFNYHTLLNYAPWMYLAIQGLLLALLLVGIEVAGAKRWIRMGGVSFQVS